MCVCVCVHVCLYWCVGVYWFVDVSHAQFWVGSKVSKCVPKSPGCAPWTKNPSENTGLVYGVKPMVQTSFPPKPRLNSHYQILCGFGVAVLWVNWVLWSIYICAQSCMHKLARTVAQLQQKKNTTRTQSSTYICPSLQVSEQVGV